MFDLKIFYNIQYILTTRWPHKTIDLIVPKETSLDKEH